MVEYATDVQYTASEGVYDERVEYLMGNIILTTQNQKGGIRYVCRLYSYEYSQEKNYMVRNHPPPQKAERKGNRRKALP